MDKAKDWIRIYILKSANPDLAHLCEHALETDSFQPCWRMPNSNYVITFVADGLGYIGVIKTQEGNGLEDALLISAVYRTGTGEVSEVLAHLRWASRPRTSRFVKSFDSKGV
ncbi:MAG: hypothetical protein V4559_10780 [Pseudomonadota bacterium]